MQMDDVDQGKEVRSDDEMPKEMEEEQLLLFAKLDIFQEELMMLEKKLKEYTDVVEEKDSRDVLAYGLQQTGQLHDGVLSEIDGQIVEKVNGVLCICDPRSPYDQLPVVSYRELASAWIENMKMEDQKILKTMQDTARKAGKELPRYFTRCSGAVRVPKNLLPPCPEMEEVSTVPEEEEDSE